MDVIRSESERSRFLPDYLSVLKEFFNDFFSLNSKNEIILGPVFEKKIFWKIIEPVIFEEFFIENWESFKKWKTKGFLYYFYYE